MKRPLFANSILYKLVVILLLPSFLVEGISVDSINGRDSPACLGLPQPAAAPPCKTVDYAANNMTNGSTVMLTYGQEQVIHNDIIVQNLYNITLTTSNTSQHTAVVVKCIKYGTGLKFINVNNLTVFGVSFQECGGLHISTSVSSHNPKHLLLFRSAMYVLNSTNVLISGSEFYNNTGIGVVLYDVSGTIVVKDTLFSSNMVPRNEVSMYPGGGGMYVELTLCTPGIPDGKCNSSDNPFSFDNDFQIVNCNFTGNSASTLPNSQVTYTKRAGPILNKFGCGGALYLSVRGSATDNNFRLSRSSFTGNSASFGGGICVELEDKSKNNTFIFDNLTMERNKADQGGGGIDFGAFNTLQLSRNAFLFQSCKFIQNKATIGGGVMMFSNRSPFGKDFLSLAEFNSCSWIGNTAYLGAAVALTPEVWEILPSGYLPTPLFHNCLFIANILECFSLTSSECSGQLTVSGGILFSDSMSINISGFSSFDDNRGSSIHISAAEINFMFNSVTQFSENKAHRGGAIALMGYSFMIAHSNSTVVFNNNHAIDRGGAIFHSSIDIVDFFNSHRCFIRYYEIIPPDLWNTSFVFKNNTAGTYGSAVYVSTLIPCALSSLSNATSLPDNGAVFHWRPFSFTPALTNRYVIATDPANITANHNATFRASPGIPFTLPISITDDLHQEINSVLVANYDSSVSYITDKTITVNGNTSSLQLTLESSESNRPVATSIDITLAPCPPGYLLSQYSFQCECITNSTSSQDALPGVIGCNEHLKRVYVRNGYWAGCADGDHGDLVVAECPLGFCNYADAHTETGFLPLLPSNCSALEGYICSQGNRKGRICGECVAGHSVYFHSNRYKCGDCTLGDYGIVLYIVSELVPLTALFIFIVLFDINMTSGSVNGFIFFVQTLDIFFTGGFSSDRSYTLPEQLQLPSDVYWFVSGFFNFDFFRLDSLSFCLWNNATVLDVLIFKYITTFYGLALIVLCLLLFSCCRFENILKKCRITSSKGYTVTNGITGFLILSYSQCAKVSFQILTHTDYYSTNGTRQSVVFLSGVTPFFGKEHIKYAIPALTVSVCIIMLPLILIINPLYHTCKKFFASKQILADNVSSINRSVAQNRQCYCLPKINLLLKPIFDSLQACYKEDLRFFAGLMFLYRLLVSIIFAFTTSGLSTFALLEMTIIFIIITHSIFQPYWKRSYNILDTLMMGDLAIINGITLYNVMATQYDLWINHDVITTIQLILVYIPMLYFVSIVLFALVKYVKRFRDKICSARDNDELVTAPLINDDDTTLFDEDHLPARMFDRTLESQRLSYSRATPNDSSRNSEETRSTKRYRYGLHTT